MTQCEHGHEGGHFRVGLFDLLDLCQRMRDGEAWELAKKLGLAEEDPADKGWMITEKGAQILVVSTLMGLEIVSANMEDDSEEEQQWRNSVLANLGTTVVALSQRGLLRKEVEESMDALVAEGRQLTEEHLEHPPMQNWVELD